MKKLIVFIYLFSAASAWADFAKFESDLQNYDDYLTRGLDSHDGEAALTLSNFAYACAQARDIATQELCVGLPYNTISDGLYWLTEAADRGNVRAQIKYAELVPLGIDMKDKQAVKTYRKQARSYLDAAISTGSGRAIFMNWRWVMEEKGWKSTEATEAYAWVLAAIECGYKDGVAYKALHLIPEDYEVNVKKSQKTADKIIQDYCATNLNQE